MIGNEELVLTLQLSFYTPNDFICIFTIFISQGCQYDFIKSGNSDSDQ